MRRTVSAAVMLALAWVMMLAPPVFAQQKAGQGYFDIGVFSYEAGDYNDAEKNFKQALAVDAANPEYHHFLGKTYMEAGRYDEAVKALEQARSIDPNLPELGYDWALVHYKMEKYAEAARLFEGIVSREPDNLMARYLAGMSHYKAEQYESALPQLASAEKSPSIKYNSMYYEGLCYHKLGQIDSAREKFVAVRDGAESKSLAENAAAWVNAIDGKARETKRWALAAKLDAKLTDNLLLIPSYDKLYVDEVDTVYSGFLSGRYNLISTGQTVAGVSYSHYQSIHEDNGNYDLIASIGDLFIKYRSGDYMFSLSYSPSYYWMDKASYLTRHKVTPAVTRQLSQNLIGTFTYSYANDKNHFNFRRDAHNHDLFLELGYAFPQRGMRLTGGAGYEANLAVGPENDYDRFSTELGFDMNLFWGVKASQEAEYRYTEYDMSTVIPGKDREEQRYSYELDLSRNITEWLKAGIEYEYVSNDANISNHDYRSNAVAFYLIATI